VERSIAAHRAISASEQPESIQSISVLGGCAGKIGGKMILALVLVVLLIVLGLSAVSIYNRLVRARNEVKNAWSAIGVQLKRRHDLIPNIVDTVKGYASHEKGTLEAVTAARQQAVSFSGSVEERVKVENALTQTLRSLLAVAEAYPDLKANQNFLGLQEELAGTENKIGFSRQYYNDAAMRYKNRVEMFPSNVVAGMFGFQPEPFFQIEEAADRVVPKVSF
jgi:LemA protein